MKNHVVWILSLVMMGVAPTGAFADENPETPPKPNPARQLMDNVRRLDEVITREVGPTLEYVSGRVTGYWKAHSFYKSAGRSLETFKALMRQQERFSHERLVDDRALERVEEELRVFRSESPGAVMLAESFSSDAAQAQVVARAIQGAKTSQETSDRIIAELLKAPYPTQAVVLKVLHPQLRKSVARGLGLEYTLNGDSDSTPVSSGE